MYANLPSVSLLFVERNVYLCGGGCMCAQVDCSKKCTKKKHDLCLWAAGVCMSGWAILGMKSCISQKLIPQARIMDKWVPADWGGGGGNALRLRSHRSQMWLLLLSWSSHIVQLKRGWPPTTEKKHRVKISVKRNLSADVLNLAARSVNSPHLKMAYSLLFFTLSSSSFEV